MKLSKKKTLKNPMFKITKRPLVKEDLKDIWRYTYREWGEKQADKYLLEISKEILKKIYYSTGHHNCRQIGHNS